MGRGYTTRTLIDPVTGEQIQTLNIVRKIKDKDFTKVFASELLSRLSEADTDLPVKNVLRIFRFITQLMELADSGTNMVYATVSELSRSLMIGRNTTHRYLKCFQELGLIKNIGYGKWQLDPAVFSQVAPEDRRNILVQYKAVKTKSKEDKNQQCLFEEEVEPELLEAVNA